jgi:CAAX protease family protein
MGQNPGIRAPKNRVVIFLIAVTILSAIAFILDSRGLFGRAGSLAYMWCPGLAAIITSVVTRRSLKAIGWTSKLKWLGIGWLLPIAFGFVAYGLVWITGLGGVPKDSFVVNGGLTIGMPGKPAWEIIVAAFGYISVLMLLPSMITALGEEIGWRGFLVPELADWVGARGACVFSGMVWALWHMPAILWHGYGGEGGTPRAYQVACFTAMVMLSAIVMGWLRLKSGTVWPSALVHATHNAIIQNFFDHITAPKAYTAWFVGEFGCALLLPIGLMAWYSWRELPSVEAVYASGPALPDRRAARVAVRTI